MIIVWERKLVPFKVLTLLEDDIYFIIRQVLIDDDGLLLEERESFTFTAASDAKGAATVTTDISRTLFSTHYPHSYHLSIVC